MRAFRASSLILLAVALGCGTLRKSEKVPSPALHDPSYLNKPMADGLAAAFAHTPPTTTHPINALAVSGGGQFAAFDAGVLVGWTENGTRPQFDIVTGVSSGAIVAIYAFLGPKYDCELAKFFNTAKDRDLFRYSPGVSLFKTQSLAQSDRLEKLIEEAINCQVLEELRAAHASGRRLYTATMNVRTRRPCLWDIGAIACSGRPDADALVRKVALATMTLPGVLPAVKFDVEVDGCRYCEEHVDGGAVTQIFLRMTPGSEIAGMPPGHLRGSNLYCMAAGKIYPPLIEDKLTFIKRVTTILSGSLYALYRAELMNLYALCQVSGMQFHSIAIPQDAEAPKNSTTFNPEAMQKLFALGKSMACPTVQWRLTAPTTEPGEEELPRNADQLVPADCKKNYLR